MFEGWSEYFFMVGSSSAALIGLMFVVVTLSAGRDRAEMESGKQLYTSPIVWHLAVILLLSGAALAPSGSPRLYGLATGVFALFGIAVGIRNAVGIKRASVSPATTFDSIWYGIVPAAVYLGLGAAAVGVLGGYSWGASAVAGSLMALLLVSIHAEWDLVTFLAPLAAPVPDKSGNENGG
jgi:hypothetical protein